MVLTVLSGLDLLISSDMLLQSPDSQVTLDGPGRGEQAARQNNRTREKVKVYVGSGSGG
jgi:hypothetical protein